MDSNNQVENLKKALDLELLISSSKEKLSCLLNENFRQPPEEPQKITWSPNYPEIKITFKDRIKCIEPYMLIIMFVCIFGLFPVSLFLFFKEYKKAKITACEKVKNSEEYRKQCEEIDRDVSERQAKSDLEFEEALNEYENILMPQYKKELAAWTKNHNREITEIQNILNTATDELIIHYENTKIIPLQYRNIEALQYIYDMISTSDYDIKQVIENYDRDMQRRLDKARLQEQQILNEQQRQANELAAVNASLLQEQNDIAERARRDANIAAAVGTIQRHNINKNLKK